MTRITRTFCNRLAQLSMMATLCLYPNLAQALHPADFPHQHVEHPEGEPPKSDEAPDEDYEANVFGTYAGLGFTGGAFLENGSNLAKGISAGGGFEVFLGWRLNSWTGVELNWTTTFHPTEDEPGFKVASALVGTLSGLVRVYVLEPSTLEPYIALGPALMTANGGPQSSVSLMGVGFTGVVGLDIHMNPWLSLGLKATYLGSYVDNTETRLDYLPDFPAEATFLSMMTGSTHLRFNF